MATLTIYSDSADGYVYSYTTNTTYADARSGTGTATKATDSGGDNVFVAGQMYTTAPPYNYPTYYCYEAFISFDTSVVLPAYAISDITLSLYCQGDNGVTDFETEVRVYDWGGAVTTADWVAGASLSSYTKVATFDSTGVSTAAYSNLTKLSTFFTSLNTSGSTRLMLCSKEQTDNSAPTTAEYLTWYSSDETGTTNDPKIVVTYSTTAIKKVAGVVYA